MQFNNYRHQPTLPTQPCLTAKMNKNKFACIVQQDHCMFLFRETRKVILKSNCSPHTLEIGHSLWQCVLSGPEARVP